MCMNHDNGRCASDDESIVVSSGSLPSSVSTSKHLVVVRGTVAGTTWTLDGPQLSLVGQNSGTVTGTAGSAALTVNGGDLYVRNVSFKDGLAGISVSGGAKLRLEHVTVAQNGTGLYCASGTTVTATAATGFSASASSNDTPIGKNCTGVSSCGDPSATCGAQ